MWSPVISVDCVPYPVIGAVSRRGANGADAAIGSSDPVDEPSGIQCAFRIETVFQHLNDVPVSTCRPPRADPFLQGGRGAEGRTQLTRAGRRARCPTRRTGGPPETGPDGKVAVSQCAPSIRHVPSCLNRRPKSIEKPITVRNAPNLNVLPPGCAPARIVPLGLIEALKLKSR